MLFDIMDMIDGKVGNVVEVGNIDGMKVGEFEFVLSDKCFDGDFEVKGMEVGDVVGECEEFECEVSELLFVRSDGYRGECCYDGYVVRGDKLYWMDLVGDGVVCEMVKSS